MTQSADYIGRVGLDADGVIGVIETAKVVTDELTFHTIVVTGRTLFGGTAWTAVDPQLIQRDEERKLRSAAAWWKDQES